MTREEAIQFLRRCRETHQLWIDHFNEHHDEQSYACCVGDRSHHEEIVEQYDAVIELLKGP